jgi:cytochrome c peroxidase
MSCNGKFVSGRLIVVMATLAAAPALGAGASDPAGTTAAPYRSSGQWIAPGSGAVLPGYTTYQNDAGVLGVLNTRGPVSTAGHPFFEPLGSNGRACVTCHQPADAMSLSAKTVQERWTATAGKDPLFAAVDGANCPNLPMDQPGSHSLLLTKGLFRVSMPWPPKARDGRSIEPEFSIEVINDPTGCNLDSQYGLKSPSPKVSVFRRPRVVANIKYVESEKPLGVWQVRTGKLLEVDPETGNRLAGNLMADGRAATLRAQMNDAAMTHLQAATALSRGTQDVIREFELQLYAAQVGDSAGGSLQEGGANLGPGSLRDGRTAVLGAFPHEPAFPELDGWVTSRITSGVTWAPLFKFRPFPAQRPGEASESPPQHAYRDSVARGYLLFMYRQFLIRDVSSLNPLLGNPVKQTCADCHNMQRTGMDNAPGYLGLGTNNYPTATPAPDLPLFKVTCRKDRPPHPYLGRVIYTHDPGRALVTGNCADVGEITAQQFRGLAARAPYFAGGSAKTLREVIEFYDRRFSIGYSEQDIDDMANFLGAL